MRGSKHYLLGLSTLHQLEGDAELRATFRQSMATLAEATLESSCVPLEGLNPDHLLLGVRAALAANLIDDLSFLSAPGAACALYGLASALPLGPERRELGRRVLRLLHEGHAATFVSLAKALALGSTRAFDGAAMHARVALSLVLPIGTGAPADELALTLVSRRELSQCWLVEPSTGSLAARRMAARLLERAAREATRRALQGDDGVLGLFDGHTVKSAWLHLMADREPLVWRHVATARGLLSVAMPRFADEVEGDLAAPRSLSRNRRGAASLAARLAIEPQQTIGRAKQILSGPLLVRDPGLASAMIYGLPRPAEVEPEAAEELLHIAVERGGPLAAEALLDLRREWFGTEFGLKAAEIARVSLRQRYGKGCEDDGHAALIDLLCEELGEQGSEREENLPDAVFAGLTAFATEGAREAYERARVALSMAEAKVERLAELEEDGGPKARIELFRIMHELDAGLLESNALADLLCLGAPGNDTAKTTAPLSALTARLTRVLMARETRPHTGGENVPHLTLRIRRLRTLLHLLDVDLHDTDDRAPEASTQRVEDVRALCERVERDSSSAMDRVVHAAVARGCDSLVRGEIFELSDVLLSVASHVMTPEGFSALSEGSMLPEVKHCLRALTALVRTLHAAPPARDASALVEALHALSLSLPVESAQRTEGLRSTLSRLARALGCITAATSLRELAQDPRSFELLEVAIEELSQLTAGARRRLGTAENGGSSAACQGVVALGLAVERASHDVEGTGFELTLQSLAESLRVELPRPLAAVIMRILQSLPGKPRSAIAPHGGVHVRVKAEIRLLPAWLPPSRTLGGFYVQRALGAGAGGSVFVVKRVEERNDPRALSLALKVPEYDGSAARSLSEEEFLRMFRQEAGAMLAVPAHRNLASFVTFEAGAKPKPILVMELVEGDTLERVLAKGDLDMPRALSLIDGMLSGLEAMHSVGVGHLDVKPSNVILRERGRSLGEPVLVDFGLSGRHVRPGCATRSYGAPEIWGLLPEGLIPAPMPADIYALGCVAFELMTGRVLFEAPSEAAMIACHIEHDGAPEAVQALLARAETRSLAEWLASCLRRDPRKRATATQLRAALKQLAPHVSGAPWPLPS
jgi:serine/threonine protein kinase